MQQKIRPKSGLPVSKEPLNCLNGLIATDNCIKMILSFPDITQVICMARVPLELTDNMGGVKI